MKYLQILNAALLALGASVGLCMGVVCFLYGVHLDAEPQLRAEMPRLYGVTAVFSALGVAGLVAFVAQRRRWLLRWLAQLLPVLPIVGMAIFIARMRNG